MTLPLNRQERLNGSKGEIINYQSPVANYQTEMSLERFTREAGYYTNPTK